MRRLILEWKQMGWAAVLTPLLFLLALLYAYLVRDSEFALELNDGFQQVMLSFGGGWLPLVAISDFFSGSKRNFFYQFRDFRTFLGITLWAKWLAIVLLAATMVGYTSQRITGAVQMESIGFWLSQIVWMAALAYCALAWTSEFGWAALILFVVSSGAFLSKGSMLGPLNYYIPPFSGIEPAELLQMASRNVCWGGVFFVIGALRLKFRSKL